MCTVLSRVLGADGAGQAPCQLSCRLSQSMLAVLQWVVTLSRVLPKTEVGTNLLSTDQATHEVK